MSRKPAEKDAAEPSRVPRPGDPVDANLWAHLQSLALGLPAGSPGRLIATEARPTFGEFVARLPLYERLLAVEVA